jgi:hypothetical protein
MVGAASDVVLVEELPAVVRTLVVRGEWSGGRPGPSISY